MRHFLVLLLAALAWPALLRASQPVSVLAEVPRWSDLAPFQKTITRADFLRLLDTVYAPGGAWKECIEVGSDSARIHQPGEPGADFRLEFAKDAASAVPVPRYWTPPGALKKIPGKPLAGYTIALDPGHLGGRWARMEERWFQIGDAAPVMEGEMVWLTAQHLSDRLKTLGANVVLVRKGSEPVTGERPRSLRREAKAELAREGIEAPRDRYDGPSDPLKSQTVQWQSELLFYRISEIRARAQRINHQLKPDLVICLHCNAEEWGDPAHPQLTDKNHLHLLVNGNYHSGELALADIRHEMLLKLLGRSARVELPLSSRVAASLARATGLPPYEYHSGKARVTDSPYVWTRNLLANRLYRCPVVYCEPYVMNSQIVFDRVQLGDYAGMKSIGGMERKSLYREYADAVADGVANYFAEKGN
ncbi:MAG: hypothetical protein NTZ46_02465 [Verrucomicrobia bacterium]|nr:hypothetical protein [Verrucomicrobiota bacterium]